MQKTWLGFGNTKSGAASGLCRVRPSMLRLQHKIYATQWCKEFLGYNISDQAVMNLCAETQEVLGARNSSFTPRGDKLAEFPLLDSAAAPCFVTPEVI
jgi:hypothetical protein